MVKVHFLSFPFISLSSPLPIKARAGPGSKPRKVAVSPYRDREPPFDPDPTKANPSLLFDITFPSITWQAHGSSTQVQAFIIRRELVLHSADIPLRMSCCISLMSGLMQRRVSTHYHDYLFVMVFDVKEEGCPEILPLALTLHMQNRDPHRQHTPSSSTHKGGRFRSFYWALSFLLLQQAQNCDLSPAYIHACLQCKHILVLGTIWSLCNVNRLFHCWVHRLWAFLAFAASSHVGLAVLSASTPPPRFTYPSPSSMHIYECFCILEGNQGVQSVKHVK